MDIKTREDLQLYGSTLLQQDNYLLEWCTGVGKTRVPLFILKPEDKVLIVHGDRTYYLKSWQEEIRIINSNINAEFTTLQSLTKYVGQEFDYLIFDEADLITPNYLEIFQAIKFNRYIFLSAKVKKDKKDLLKKICRFKVHIVKLEEAIEKEWLPKPEIRVIYLTLDNVHRVHQYILRPKQAQTVTINYPDRWNWIKVSHARVVVKCTAQEYYNYLTEQIDYFKGIGKFDIANMRGSARKRFLAELKSDVVRKLVLRHSGDRIVTFAGSIAQCEELAGDKAKIHSKQKAAINRQMLESYNNYEVNELYNVGSLVRAVSLTSLDIGIVLTLTGDTVEGYQKLGRLMRSKIPIIYFPTFKNTTEKSKFDKLMGEIKQDYKIVEI